MFSQSRFIGVASFNVFLLSVFSLFLVAHPAFATTRYIAQTAGTFTGGIACKGQAAITPASFNSTTLSPGDTIYICGTITGAQNQTLLNVSQSGTSGNPITIFFDSGAVLAATQWPAGGSGGAINISGANYITINGNGGTGGYTQGIIESTLTGDSGATCPGGPCTIHTDSNGIEADSSNNVTIEGLAIIDMYVTAPGVPSGGGSQCIYANEGSNSNWIITNNLFHDVSWCINFQFTSGTSTNNVISNNTIYNIDHGIAIGGAAGGATFENLNVFGNNIHDYSNWDTSGDVWHHDGIHIWGEADNGSDPILNVNIYNNKFGGCVGQNVTAHIFIEANAGSTKNVAIYNNTLIDTCNGADTDGLLTTGEDGGYQIYNNTFMGTSADTCVGTSSSPNVTFVNNVVSGCGMLQYIASGGGFASGGLHNNIYANCTTSNCFAFPGGYTASLASWQSYTNQDASPSAYVASADLNSAGVPQSGSPVIGVGANLTSLTLGSLLNGILGTLDTDINGNPRPATGAWTAGAYSTSGTGPQPPTALTGTAVVN